MKYDYWHWSKHLSTKNIKAINKKIAEIVPPAKEL